MRRTGGSGAVTHGDDPGEPPVASRDVVRERIRRQAGRRGSPRRRSRRRRPARPRGSVTRRAGRRTRRAARRTPRRRTRSLDGSPSRATRSPHRSARRSPTPTARSLRTLPGDDHVRGERRALVPDQGVAEREQVDRLCRYCRIVSRPPPTRAVYAPPDVRVDRPATEARKLVIRGNVADVVNGAWRSSVSHDRQLLSKAEKQCKGRMQPTLPRTLLDACLASQRNTSPVIVARHVCQAYLLGCAARCMHSWRDEPARNRAE